MPYVTFESMEHEETTNLAEKSTILDGRRRRRRGNVVSAPFLTTMIQILAQLPYIMFIT